MKHLEVRNMKKANIIKKPNDMFEIKTKNSVLRKDLS